MTRVAVDSVEGRMNSTELTIFLKHSIEREKKGGDMQQLAVVRPGMLLLLSLLHAGPPGHTKPVS